MTTFMLKDGKFLLRDGKFAISSDCCCGDVPISGCCDARETPWPDRIWGRIYNACCSALNQEKPLYDDPFSSNLSWRFRTGFDGSIITGCDGSVYPDTIIAVECVDVPPVDPYFVLNGLFQFCEIDGGNFSNYPFRLTVLSCDPFHAIVEGVPAPCCGGTFDFECFE